MIGIQIGKEQEERKREEEGLNFETTPWWNFVTIMGYADEELRSASLSSLSNCGLNPRRGEARRCIILRVNPIFSSVLSQNSKLLVIAQLHPRSTEHLMSNIHLHNTIQHAFAALMQVQTSHLCMMILSRKSCTHHHHHQRRRQWIIFAVPTETKLGSTTFRFGSEHQRKMSSIDPATEQSRLCESRRSVILLIEDSRVIGVFCWRLIFAFCGRALC